jgi:hypothetical protein
MILPITTWPFSSVFKTNIDFEVQNYKECYLYPWFKILDQVEQAKSEKRLKEFVSIIVKKKTQTSEVNES